MSLKKTLIVALSSLVALTAVAPAQAAVSPEKREKRMIRMIKKADMNGDKRVSLAEFDAQVARAFAVVDVNRDGVLTKSEIAQRKSAFKAFRQAVKAQRQNGQHVKGVIAIPGKIANRFERVDGNRDGVLSRGEVSALARKAFARRDRNGDGFISTADLRA